jgi:hypothetical protein
MGIGEGKLKSAFEHYFEFHEFPDERGIFD